MFYPQVIPNVLLVINQGTVLDIQAKGTLLFARYCVLTRAEMCAYPDDDERE